MTDFGLGSQCREHWRRGPNCAAWGHGFGGCRSWIEPFLETSYVRFHRSRRTSVKSESQCDTEAASLFVSFVRLLGHRSFIRCCVLLIPEHLLSLPTE